MHLRNVYMVGIGGIGMSGLAQMLERRGSHVEGSDRCMSPTTDMLERAGIAVHIGHDADNVPKDATLLVYSDAVPMDGPERVRARELGIPEKSYFEALGIVSEGFRTIAIAGTHGKTTTTGMLARILREARKEPTAIIGSIVRDFGSNFLAGKSDTFVVEACEYKDHLLKLSPTILVITNVELDHTDHFPNLAAVQETFRKALAKVPEGGAIITDPHDKNIKPLLKGIKTPVIDYTRESVPPLKQIGEFNKMNARAAKAAAKVAYPDLTDEVIDDALGSFQGSWRRFEFKGETKNGALVYDDYGHHPTEVAKTIEAAREKFAGKKIVVAFHPHTYSRTRDLFGEFVAALTTADEAIILPVFAAREVPDPAVSHEALVEAINKKGGHAHAVAGIPEAAAELEKYDNTHLLITMGAGDVYKAAEMVTEE